MANNYQTCDITLISTQNIFTPTGALATQLKTLAESVKGWFLEAQLPLPSAMPESDTCVSDLSLWTENLSEVSGQKTQQLWQNLTSGEIELYIAALNERQLFQSLETTRKSLLNQFQEILSLCDDFPSLATAVTEEHRLFRRASVVFLAMIQGYERTLNSWRQTHAHLASKLLNQRISSLKKQNAQYRIAKTIWNDECMLFHEDLDVMSAMTWINSSIINAFISRLNVKFSCPAYDRHVLFFDTDFTFLYILPGNKSPDTLKNREGSIKHKPLKALANRFNGGKVTLIFPLNVNASHWSVGAICGLSSTIAFYDSLEGFSSQSTYQIAYEASFLMIR
ncbi:hypothetical protein F5880DRAFT_1509737 [Lentinula raphanica]|nr:hypothetical protein F5880DRAFT_1509737 [Lentinula raphanica]